MEPYLRAAWISSFATVRTQAERLPPLMLSISKRRVSKWKPLEWIWAYNSVAVATVERRRRKSLIGLIMSLLAFFWWLLAKATKGCVCEKAAKEKRLKRPADEQELRFKFCYCCCVAGIHSGKTVYYLLPTYSYERSVRYWIHFKGQVIQWAFFISKTLGCVDFLLLILGFLAWPICALACGLDRIIEGPTIRFQCFPRDQFESKAMNWLLKESCFKNLLFSFYSMHAELFFLPVCGMWDICQRQGGSIVFLFRGIKESLWLDFCCDFYPNNYICI